MKISLKTIPHISSKIAVDLNRSGVVTMTQGLERVAQEAEKVLVANVKQEMALEEKVSEICDENEEEIYSEISHKILDELYEEDLIHFDVSENRIKNIIYGAITSFIAEASEIEDAIMDKIRTYKKRYIPGTDEFDILHEKLYREELQKRGME